MLSLKKNIALISALVLAGTMLAGCKKDETDDNKTNDNGTTKSDVASNTGEEGKVLRIYAWNDTMKSQIEPFYTAPAGVEVEWVITPTDGNAYQDKLDSDLPKNVGSSNPIDIFLIEADYAVKYVKSDFSVDIAQLGITSSDLADMYQYNLDVCTDGNAIKGLSYENNPGLFIYKTKVAEEVLGTSDPTEVNALLNTWDKFDEVAGKMKDAGYTMLAGPDDAYRLYSNNVSAPWVDENDKIQIDDNLMKWVDVTKTYWDNGWNAKAVTIFSDAWTAQVGVDSKTFGFFGPGWFINWQMGDKSGAYMACEPPVAFNWGGTWACAAQGTDNTAAVADFMKQVFMNESNLETLAKGGQVVNNTKVMEKLANDPSFGNDALSGQNHYALLASAATRIDMTKISAYDQGCTEAFQAAFVDYFNGTIKKEEALENFYTTVLEKYPFLKR